MFKRYFNELQRINLQLCTFYSLLVLNDGTQVDINLSGRKQLALLHTLFWEAQNFPSVNNLVDNNCFFMDSINNFEQITYQNIFHLFSLFKNELWTYWIILSFFMQK